MNRYLPPLLIALVLWSGACSSSRPDGSGHVPLTILHWNDFHARNVPHEVERLDTATGERIRYSVGGTANLIGYMNAHGRGQANVLVLNAGDDFQGSPISAITKGRSQIELMNIINPDVMVLGNHEFDYGHQNLRENISISAFPIIAANLYDSLRASTFVPPATVKKLDGLTAGIIGLLPPDLPTLSLKSSLEGLGMLPIDSVVVYHMQRLRNDHNVNLIIVLSHMGVQQDTALARRVDGIDVIIGGHTHLALHTPLIVNRTIICQAGQWGRYLGKLQLVVDTRGDSVLSHSGQLIETLLGKVPVDSVALTRALAFEKLVDDELNTVIGTLEKDWVRAWDGESNIGNWQADAMRDFAGADIAFMNSGGIRKNMWAGPITKRDMWEINPFGNTFVTFAVTGATLTRMLEWQAAVKGEPMQVSGLRYSYDPLRPEGARLVDVTVAGRPINPERRYTIVTNNYVAGHLDKLLGMEEDVEITDLGVVDRDVFIDYVQRQQSIRSELDGRIHRIQTRN
jgi:5'-nucleotidase/UDP-sugar diphosphatase